MTPQRWKACLCVPALSLLLAWAAETGAADSTALELVQTIDLKGKPGGLDHLMLDAKRQRLFVANKANNTLDVIDLKEGKLLRQIKGQQGVQGLAFAPDLDLLFAALGAGGFVNVFDGEMLKLVKTIKVGEEADNIHYHQATHRLYVAHGDQLGVIDAKNFSVITDIKLPGEAENFLIEPEGGKLFLTNPSANQVEVIDTAKDEITGHFLLKLGGKDVTLGLDEANKRLILGCRKPAAVVVIEKDSGKEVSSVEIPGDVDDLWFDAKRKRVYVSCGEGFLVALQQKEGDKYELLEKVSTAKGAGTCFFDEESGRLFLAVPRQEGKQGPEIRVYQAKS